VTAPLLEVEDLSKSYTSRGSLFGRGRVARIVRGVSFSIDRGQTFGLVGESGSGKSTIGRLALRLIEADAGRIRFDGIDVRALSPRGLVGLRRRMQIVFQDPFSALDPRLRIGEALAQPIRLHRLRRGPAVRERVSELLDLVGLPENAANRWPHEFSGGQRQRIAIARALAVEPDLIVCDEAVSALDLSIQAQILNLLLDLQKRLGLAYLFISHDMAVVRHMAASVGVLYAGRLVEQGPAADVLASPQHPYSRMLLASSPRPVLAGPGADRAIVGEPPSPYDEPKGCAFLSRCADAGEECGRSIPALSPIADSRWSTACLRNHALKPITIADDGLHLMSDAYQRRIALLKAARAKRHKDSEQPTA
jgi:peptide/nickel transport system ATP-binding protein/oligopeptide transport system ATP-binding protein